MCYSGVSIQKLRILSVSGVKEENIESILKNINELKQLKLHKTRIRSNIFKHLKTLEEAHFLGCMIENPIILPKITRLTLLFCIGVSKISCSQINYLHLKTSATFENLDNWLVSFGKLRELVLVGTDLNCFLPSIRHFSTDRVYSLENCANLISLAAQEISLKTMRKSYLKTIKGKLSGNVDGKCSTRLRKVKVTDSNADCFNNHPEILSKCKEIEVNSLKFNFDSIGNESLRLILTKFDEESLVLSRF